MGLHKLSVVHSGQFHTVDYDSDEGEEILKVQLFSVTNVLPENQNLHELAEFVNGLHSLSLVEGQDGMYTLKPVGGNQEPVPVVQPSPIVTTPLSVLSDEDLARTLQADEDALFARQQTQVQSQHGRATFEAKLQSYYQQVMQYEDVSRQNAARASVSLDDLEEKALVALAREGKTNVSDSEKDYAILVQLLLWFKKSFKWINEPDCNSCGSKSMRIGVGHLTSEELSHGGNRVELFRCSGCHKEVRFPRYNDPVKLLETRSGRCGEWANCFTLYCRAFGYQARLVLDFTDHVWTECFSKVHNRWVHLDPCEAAYDKPLLYESGWKKKLSYVIALANDGVYDVTKRYTRKWSEVLSRRTEVTEAVVQDVVFTLTARARLSKLAHELEMLQIRDGLERDELAASLVEASSSPSPLPGRQSGSQQWRMLRGEVGSVGHNSISLAVDMNPIRTCVDEHVKDIILALGELLKSTEPIRVTRLWGKVLQKLLSQPYKMRKELFGTGAWLKDECSSPLLQALGLQRGVQETQRVLIQLGGNHVKTALALPVAIEQLEDLNQELERKGGLNVDLTIYSQWRRVSGGTACASGEELPFELASAAFDGLKTTKWLDKKGATGGWIEYRLSEGNSTILVGYQITSANDAPERDPMAWLVDGLVDGGDDVGQIWKTLDSRQGEYFNDRFLKKRYEIDAQKKFQCSVFRFCCLSAREATNSQTPLQIANIDFFSTKND